MPLPSITESVRCLDWRRLGKQRLEALQIFRIVADITPDSRWRHHPAVKMWMGYTGAIAFYMDSCIEEWIKRGYKNTMFIQPLDVYRLTYPSWIKDSRVNASHRSNLLRKDFNYYSQFGWTDPIDLPYYWPTPNDTTH